MVATTATVVVTHDLSKGVVLGVVLSAIFFMRKVGKTVVVEPVPTADEDTLSYRVRGQLFFASAGLFAAGFEHHGHPRRVVIDLTEAHLWDLTGVDALDRVVFKYRKQGAVVEVVGMNEASRTLVDRMGLHDKRELPA
jgi:SulP family sulfate permease